MSKIDKIRNIIIVVLFTAVAIMGLTIFNYYAISSDDRYSMPFQFKVETDGANVSTITGIGVEAQILNLESSLVNNTDSNTDNNKTNESIDIDIYNKPIKLNYRIKWNNIGVCYILALLVEGLAYGVCVIIKKLKIYLNKKDRKGSIDNG